MGERYFLVTEARGRASGDRDYARVLASLKAIQQSTPLRSSVMGEEDPNCSSRLKATYVGHSFGGLIMVSAMSQSLIQDVAADRERLVYRRANLLPPQAASPDDLVVAVNPAIEGARFDALYGIAQSVGYPKYRAPRFIAITSRDDTDTKNLFALGRSFNTFSKKYPNGDLSGRRAAKVAMGHDPQYLTHELTSLAYISEEDRADVDTHQCDDWLAATSYPDRARIDVRRAQEFYASTEGSFDANKDGAFPRYFCASRGASEPDGSQVLVLRGYPDKKVDLNSPIWNVSTRSPIVRSHNDFMNARLVEFIRQLYVDSMFQRVSTGDPITGMPPQDAVQDIKVSP